MKASLYRSSISIFKAIMAKTIVFRVYANIFGIYVEERENAKTIKNEMRSIEVMPQGNSPPWYPCTTLFLDPSYA